MSKFSLNNGATVVILLVTFGEIDLSFSVYNILKNYLTSYDVWTKASSHKKFGSFITRVPYTGKPRFWNTSKYIPKSG